MTDSDTPLVKAEKINLDLFLENERLQDTIKKLQKKLSKLQSAQETTQNSQSVDDLEKKNFDLTEQNQQLLVELENTRKINQDLRSQIKEFQLQIQTDDTLEDNSSDELVEELHEKSEVVTKQNKIIEDLEKELIDLDQKYDKVNLRLRKQIESLRHDIKSLEEKNQKLSQMKYSNLRPQKLIKESSLTASDSKLLEKMKGILKSWPGGIKLRNLAMSMGISVANTNKFLDILKKEGIVRIDTDNVENSNPVVYPV